MKIQDHVFIVTGAASGLGAATAAMLIESGARVVLCDLAEAGRETAEKLGERARFAQADVSDEAAAQAVIDCAIQNFGALHGLVNCAGIAPAEKVLSKKGVHALGSFERVIRVNLVGSFNMLRLAAERISQMPANQEGERGAIINTASVAAFDGQIGQAAYSASKSGVAGMTLPLARELSRHGIRVMAIAPGVFETPMMAAMPQEVRDSLASLVPFPPRLGRVEEYAALVKHILENTMLNGEVIRLDGALRMPG